MLKKLKSFFAYDASNSSNSTLDKTSALDGNTLRHLSSFLKLNRDPEQDWLIVDSIGDGAFGKIYKVGLFDISDSTHISVVHTNF